MDIEEAGQIALEDLARQATVREPLIQAILDTRSCLSPFQLNFQIARSEYFDASRSLMEQLDISDIASGLTLRRASLRHAEEEVAKPARMMLFPKRNIDRMMEFPRRFRSVGAFDYEVPVGTYQGMSRSPFDLESNESYLRIEQEFEKSGTDLAAIFEWPEEWEEEWCPSELDLCSRLRMLVVRAFEGEAFLIARRESESGPCERIENRLRTLEWHEKIPETPEQLIHERSNHERNLTTIHA